MERMITLDTITRLVMPQVLPAPRSMVEDAVSWAAREFFESSEAWVEIFQEQVGYGEYELRLPVPSYLNVSRILRVDLNGVERLPGEYVFSEPYINFPFEAGHPYVVTVKAAMKPRRYNKRLPEAYVEDFGDTIAFGALARIKAMSGQGIEWTDGNGATVAQNQFNEGVAKARIEAIRARNGGDFLAVGQEYI